MENKYNIKPTFTYSDDDIHTIICSAVYDIGYWACIDNGSNEWRNARREMPKDYTFEDLMYHILKKGDGIVIYDAEDDDEYWTLTLSKLLNGIKLTIENGYWDGDIDTIDGEIGDIILQNSLFGEIVFG